MGKSLAPCLDFPHLGAGEPSVLASALVLWSMWRLASPTDLSGDTPEDGARQGELLNAHRISSVLLVTRESPVVSLEPLRIDRLDRHGRMLVQRWRR
jgi:hypothetical protein